MLYLMYNLLDIVILMLCIGWFPYILFFVCYDECREDSAINGRALILRKSYIFYLKYISNKYKERNIIGYIIYTIFLIILLPAFISYVLMSIVIVICTKVYRFLLKIGKKK